MVTATHIDDLADPRLPAAVRVVNVVGRPFVPLLARIDVDSLLSAAKKKTGLEDFGDDRFLEPLHELVRSLHHEADLSVLGRALTRQMLVGLLVTRLRVQDVIRRHPEILDERINAPIVIAGLPRTGTTHLHNLLSCDPGLRSLPYWESLDPVPPSPPPADGAPDPRIVRCEKALGFLHRVMPLFPLMHEMTATGPHEEIQLLAVDFSTMLFEASYHVPSYRDWYKAHDQTPAYGYLRLLLQILQWHRRGERWVLKSPQHLEQLGPLMATFPDATVVQTHRDPVAITASMCTMIAYGRRMQSRRVDPFEVGRVWGARLEDLLRASVDDRHVIPTDKVVDVRFHEFMADQDAAVARVYAAAGRELTDDARKAVAAFREANPRGKHGTIDYRLEDVGLDRDERRAALRFYQDRFDIPDE